MEDNITEDDMSKYALQVCYEGNGVDGRIDSEVFCESIQGITKLISTANDILNTEKKYKISIDLKGFQSGSFECNLEIIQSLQGFIDHLLPFLQAGEVYSARRVAEIIGLANSSIISVIQLIRLLKGKSFTSKVVDDKYAIFETEDHVYKVPMEVFTLMYKKDIPLSLEKLTRPLKENHIDKMSFKHTNSNTDVTIYKEDLPAFNSTNMFVSNNELVNENTLDKVVTLVSLSFDKQYVWRVSDGESTFTVRVDDPDFDDAVDRRKVMFGKGDAFLVTIEEKQYLDDNDNLKITRKITKVKKKMPRYEQEEMNFKELD